MKQQLKLHIEQLRHTALRMAMAVLVALTSMQAAQAFSPSHYADSSRLAQGTWVKISVNESGIYAITAADARRWGFSDLASLRIFGYGGEQLSEQLTESMPDDLPQVPVLRTSNAVLFYGRGPISWSQASTSVPHRQVQNPYAAAGYYFVTSDNSISDLTVSQATNSVASDNPETTFTERLYHESELVNPGETGRDLLGEDFRYTTSQSFKFSLTDYVEGSTVHVLTRFGAKTMAGSGSSVAFQYNGNNLSSSSADRITAATSINYDHYNVSASTKSFILSGTNDLTYTVSFTPTGTLYLARLDYITVNYTRSLALNNGKLTFGLHNASTSSAYQLSGTSSATHIWDVTTSYVPVEVNAATSGSTMTFSPTASGRREYVAFNEGASFLTPTLVGTVSNQNLHGEATPDMIIITLPTFRTQAERLATLHSDMDGMRVLVVNQDLIFNEFSSGTPDIMAYRKLCKMFYDRGTSSDGHKLGYLILFGNGSYDNRQLTDAVKQLGYPMLLTWQSSESSNENSSYTSDDPIVVLDDNTGPSFERGKMSIAVGRFPIKDTDEAKSSVDKLLKYIQTPDYGNWKNNSLNVADDEDNAIHMEQADNVISIAKENGGEDMIFNRVFIDAFTSVSSGGGRNYPDARTKMFRTLDEGTLWWNYTGHASPNGWTADGLLTHTDIENNLYYKHLPVLYAATCEFIRHDATDDSGGESVFFNSNGGVIALISPARLVYITNNGRLNASVAKYIFKRESDGRAMRLGDIIINGKNDTNSDANNLRYFLFGDPAMRLAAPTHKAVVETINGEAVDSENMPVFQGRQTVTFTGSITDYAGNKASNFNGNIISTLYDSEQSVTTHGYGDNGAEYTYLDRPNKLAITVDSVVNGTFSVKVTIPSEMVATYDNYSPSLINFYAYDATDSIEASGSNSDFYIYGYDDEAAADTVGPTIEYLALNTTSFRNGDNVNESPLVIAKISDASGVNFSSGGIGHNITITLDDNTTYSDVSSYYTAALADEGTSGTISYALSDLADGYHTLRLKVWDVYNNSSEETINFYVINGLKPELIDVYCDANPASVEANFYITHNRPDATVNATIEIYDLMGRKIWSTTQTGKSDSDTTNPITWSLTDFSGRRVQRGIYIYRAIISTDGVQEATKSKKIAVAAE